MRRSLTALSLLSVLASAAAARAEPAPNPLPRLGMDPGEPQARSAPPSVPFGLPPTSQQFVLDFHGYLQLPLRMGVLKRDNPSPGQSDTALHTPPLVPQNLRRFQYTGALPDTWTQLNFTYGNSTIAGTSLNSGCRRCAYCTSTLTVFSRSHCGLPNKRFSKVACAPSVSPRSIARMVPVVPG